MVHKFDEKDMMKLDNPNRRKVMPPKEILINIGLREDDSIADIGCGIGYFSIPASEIVGENGKVYAIDTSEIMLEELKKRLDEVKIKNIELVKSNEYSFGIDLQRVNFGFMCNVLHEIEDKEKFIKETTNILKENGKIVIIEWEKKETEMGPPIHHRIHKEEVKELLEKNGLKNTKTIEISKEFYMIIGEKN